MKYSTFKSNELIAKAMLDLAKSQEQKRLNKGAKYVMKSDKTRVLID